MKNFKLLLIGLSFLTFISCSKDEESDQQQIQGEWILTDATVSSKTTLVTGGVETVLDQEGNNNKSDLTMVFDANETYATSGNLIMDVDNFLDGDIVSSETINYSELGMDLSGQGVWAMLDGNLILDNDDQQPVVVNNNLMTMIIQQELVMSPNMSIDIDMELIFTKQ